MEIKSWKYKNLAEVTTKIGSGVTPRGGEKVYQKSGHPLIRSQNVGWGILLLNDVAYINSDIHESMKSTKLEFGDVLLNITGASIGRSAVVDSSIVDGNVNQHVCIVRTKESDVNPYYLNQYLISYFGQKQIESFQSGGNRQGLNIAQIHTFRIPLPTLPEQQKIAAILSKWDELIATQTQLIAAKEKQKTSLMQKLLTGEVRFPGFEEEWEEYTLGEIAEFRRGSFPQPYGLAKWYDDDKGMPFIQVFDVDENMQLKPDTKRKISELGAEHSVFVKTGTLVITIQGSIGRVAKTQYDAYVDRTLLIFKSYRIEINVDYFKYVLFLLFEIEKKKAPGGTIKTITKEVLTQFLVVIPKIEEQNVLASIFLAIDEELQLLKGELEAIKLQKKGLMQQLLTGKIRVK